MMRHTYFENNDSGKAKLRQLIRQKKLLLGGNHKLKIYGELQCGSGKRMLRENRVFFSSEKEAVAAGFRPCGHCMKDKYLQWKKRKN